MEHKWRYYEGAKYGVKPVDDYTYDFLEEKYKNLAKKLGKEAYTTDHVGFPIDTASGRLVAQYMIGSKGRSDITFKWKKDKKVKLKLIRGGKDGQKENKKRKIKKERIY